MRGGLHAVGFHPTGVVGAFAKLVAAADCSGSMPPRLRGRAGRRAVAGKRQPAVHRGRRLDQAHPPGLGGASGITAATFAAKESRRRRRHTKGATAFTAAISAGRACAHRLVARHRRHEAEARHAGKSRMSRSSRSRCVISSTPAPTRRSRCIARGRCRANPRGRSTVPAGVVQAVCEPVANKRRPNSDYDAKFSLVYAVASGLVRGRLGLKELDAGGVRRPAAQR